MYPTIEHTNITIQAGTNPALSAITPNSDEPVANPNANIKLTTPKITLEFFLPKTSTVIKDGADIKEYTFNPYAIENTKAIEWLASAVIRAPIEIIESNMEMDMVLKVPNLSNNAPPTTFPIKLNIANKDPREPIKAASIFKSEVK